MTLVDLLGLEKIFGVSIDIEKKTIELKFLGFSIKGIKYSSIKELINDTRHVERLTSELFNRKQVMWQDFSKEAVDACIESLKDLKQKCDNAAKEHTDTKKSKDAFYASLLTHWADQSDVAIKELLTAKEDEQISLDIDFGSGSYMRAFREIPRILGVFRANTLPTVKELVKLLPTENPIRIDAEKNIEFAISTVIKYYGISPEQIQDGQYEFQN